jgi:surface protein
MSRSFILINDNSTKLGHITNNPSSSDLTKDKKNKVICINKQSQPKKEPKNGPIFKICKPPTKCCNPPSYNKTILNSNLHTYEDLNDITTIELNNSNTLDFTTPIYNHYTIDPDGVLFGKTPCNLNNYLQFRQPLVSPYPIPQTPNVVASLKGAYDDPSILISWDYHSEPGAIVVSYSIYGYDFDPDTNITTPFGPYIIYAYTYEYLLTTTTYPLELSHSYYFEVYANTNFNTSAGGMSNTVLLAYVPIPISFGPIFTLYSYTPLTFQHLLQLQLQLTTNKYAVIVTWTTSPIDTGADILSYTIHITGNNGYNQTYSIPNTTTSYIIDGLNEFTYYTISITANNIVGSSEPVSTNYTIGINFNFNYKTTNTAITNTEVLNNLPFITGNGLTIITANVYVNVQPDNVDPNKKLVSVEIPQESFTFADNTTTYDGLSFQSSNYYFFGNLTEINILFFGNNGTQTKIIPLSRGGTQFGLNNQAYSGPESSVILTISNSDKPYILTKTSFEFTFCKLNNFNSDISAWVDISNVTSMAQMFLRTKEFNQDISGWDVSKVKDMSYMFNDAIAFNNGDTGNNALHPLMWTTTEVTSVAGIFNGASKFNQDISRWDVSNVRAMNQMFQQAPAFNQDLTNWNPRVSQVTTMDYMFYNATVFNNGGGIGDTTRPMTGWSVGSSVAHTDFGTGSQLYYFGHQTGNMQPNYWEYSLEQVLNGNFDTTPLFSNNSYTNLFGYNVNIIDNWKWSGNGVFILNNSLVSTPYGNGNMGAQCVLFQLNLADPNRSSASISQDIKLYSGTYKLNLYSTWRGGYPLPCSITIGTIYTTTITPTTYFVWTSAEEIMQLENLKIEILTTGTYTLTISGVSPSSSGDHETAITGVSITLV